jgi:hypothetical protein
MATSPNYAWAEPDNSSLVKNGAQDIRALGDAIDTSVWNVGYGQAGKNKIINGNFGINQRGFTTTTTSAAYGQDRFYQLNSNGTTTYSAQTFTAGTAPVAGYESINFARMVTTGQTLTSAFSVLGQKIEDVRTFAGNTVTFSFWAKAGSGTPSVSANFFQDFGSGGSAGVYSYPTTQKQAITTSWARYSFTAPVASVAGKTIGTGSFLAAWIWTSAGTDFNTQTGSLGIQTATIDIWGVQVEYGSYATPFQTATGTIQGELAACQRYYWRTNANEAYSAYGVGSAQTTTKHNSVVNFPTIMRTKPTAMDFSALNVLNMGVAGYAVTSLTLGEGNTKATTLSATVASGLTAGSFYALSADATSNGYLGFSAEL